MTQPNGFSMSFGSGYPAACEVCTAAIDGDRISTFVGDTPVVSVCLDCARDIAKIKRGTAKVA